MRPERKTGHFLIMLQARYGFTRSSTNAQSWGEGSAGALNSSDDI